MNYTAWKEYFLRNQSHFKDIDFSGDDILSEKERSTVYASLQQFQRGENSEGKHLFSFAKKNPDPEYLPCISLFIREEQSHARVLGAYMDKHHIPKIKNHWVDGVFRWLRKLTNLENTIRVLLTAEIIAKVYYRALHDATNSVLLQKICRQILQDEDQHIAFQCFTLRPFYQRKALWRKAIVRACHFILMMGTIVVVWWYHKKVFHKARYSFMHFFSDTFAVFIEAQKSIGKKEFTGVQKKLASA